jgi:hypothetical protein
METPPKAQIPPPDCPEPLAVFRTAFRKTSSVFSQACRVYPVLLDPSLPEAKNWDAAHIRDSVLPQEAAV